MPRIYNRFESKQLRKHLRQTMSKAEVILWSQLKGRQLGYKFRRQYGVGPYVVDFYCPQMRLAVEIDGGQHYEDRQATNDRQRQEYIERLGIRVIRFSDREVLDDVYGVINRLQAILTLPRAKHWPPLVPLLIRGGAPR